MNNARTAVLIIAALALASCSGDTDGQDPSDSNASGQNSDEQDSDSATSEPGAASSMTPVEGAVVSVLDFGLGLYSIDPTDGSTGEFSYAEDWYSDRQHQPVIVDGEALTIVYRQIDGEAFTNNVALAAFDLTTGKGREVAALGLDRSSDESTDTSEITLIGAGGDVVWIRTTKSSGDGDVTRRFTAHSIDTGAEVGTYSPESIDLATENGSSCTFTPEPIAVDPDGALVLDFGGLPALIAPGAADIDVLLDSCFNAEVTPLTILGADYADFVVTDDGAPLPSEAAARLLDFTPEISSGTLTTSGEAIWWLFSRTSSFSDGATDVSAIIGGFARLDRATGKLALFDLGPATGNFLDPDTNDGFTQTALTNADLQVLDGDLWIMDVRDDQPLRRLDPDTGNLDEFVIPLAPVDADGDAVDITSDRDPGDLVASTLLATDPDGVWVAVSRRTIESDDENGRTTTGAKFIDQIDPVTGAVIRSIPEGQLTGFDI